MTEIPDPPALKLDPTRLGEILLMLIPAAASATHESPAETLRDYVHSRGNAELAFIRDLFTRSTDETADRWYSGHFHATVLANYGRALMWGQRHDD